MIITTNTRGDNEPTLPWLRSLIDWFDNKVDKKGLHEYRLKNMIATETVRVHECVDMLLTEYLSLSGQPDIKNRTHTFKSPEYQLYVKSLPNTYRTQESARPLSSAIDMLDKLQKELTVLGKNMGWRDLLPANWFDLKLTAVAELGILSFANNVYEYYNSLLFACHVELRDSYRKANGLTVKKDMFKNQFRYMHTRIMRESPTLVPTMCELLRGNLSLSKQMEQDFKNLGYNPSLQTNGQLNQFFSTALDELPKLTRTTCFMGLPSLNIFAHAGKKWVQYQHSRNLKREYERNWLENHTSQLRMERERLDPNSPEYKKHTQVIAAYEDMIAELQQDIDSYLKEIS